VVVEVVELTLQMVHFQVAQAVAQDQVKLQRVQMGRQVRETMVDL
jgi:hypothetical protein